MVDTDRKALGGRNNKIDGEIVNVVQEEKRWRKLNYWPAEFSKKRDEMIDNDENKAMVSRMPSSDEESLTHKEEDKDAET